MTDVAELLERAAAVAADHPVLAAVPLLSSLLAVEKVQRVAGFRGMHSGFTLPTPTPVLDLWTFVSVPQTGVNGPSAVPMVALPAFLVVRGVLAAGYLGGIDDALADHPLALAGSVRAYALPMIGFQVLVAGAAAALVPMASLSAVVLVPLTLALVAGSYLFYGTPYLVVTAEEGLVGALGHSYRLATSGGAYAGLFVSLLAGGAALSAVATSVVVNLGLVGVLVGAVLVAPLALVVNAVAVALFRDLTERAVPNVPPERDRTGPEDI